MDIGVLRGDAQDARASPLTPLCIPPPPAMCIPPQPKRLVMRKDEAVGNKKKSEFFYLPLDNFLPCIIIYKKNSLLISRMEQADIRQYLHC
jgi:hypothetical protein